MRGTKAVSLKRELFVLHYLGSANGNATEAARRAGYRHPRMAGSRLLTKADIRAAIEAKLTGLVMSQDEVLVRMAKLATGDISDFLVIDNGRWKVDVKQLKRLGYMVKRIRATKDGPELEMESKFNALVKIGEYYGMWNREAPPAISLVELAKRLREAGEAHDRGGSVDDPN
jgi:hypothetical protein